MTEFTGIGGDGDLQAVVRGFNNGFSTYSKIENNPPTCFAPLMSTIQEDHDFVLSNYFPDLFESTTTVLDELEQLYKPFYPQTTFLSPPSTSVSRGEREPGKETLIIGPPVVAASTSTAHVVKQRRRKNQHKRVVLQVRAEGLSSDMWAWRKYGQKPIKGSPHPRSYYRCSSSKGCLARKQVERSLSDPEMFVITYTAEHCHGQPTRRNSLAGTPRNKFSTAKCSTSGDPANSTAANDSLCSAICPPTHSLETMEDEFSKQGIKKESTEEEEEDDEKQMGDCNTVLGDDDFLVGFNELDRLTSDNDLLEQCLTTFPC